MNKKISERTQTGLAKAPAAGGGLLDFIQFRDPELRKPLTFSSMSKVAQACTSAAKSAPAFAEMGVESRAAFLEEIARNLRSIASRLADRASRETGITKGCIELRLEQCIRSFYEYATCLRQREWLAVDDTAPDDESSLALNFAREIALGPIAVWTSPHIPALLTTADSDVASALAAGCSVVSIVYPATFGTSELIGHAIRSAVAKCGAPKGVFSLLFAQDESTVTRLLNRSEIKGGVFSGTAEECNSVRHRLVERTDSIPFFYATPSANPTFLLPHSLNARAEHCAAQFIEQLNIFVGQTRRSSKIVVAANGDGFHDLLDAMSNAVEKQRAQPMFSPHIYRRYVDHVTSLRNEPRLQIIAEGPDGPTPGSGRTVIFLATADFALSHPWISDHCFGPAGLVIECEDVEGMKRVANSLGEQESVVIHRETEDDEVAADLVRILQTKTIRLYGVSRRSSRLTIQSSLNMDLCFPFDDLPLAYRCTAAIRRFLRPIGYFGQPLVRR